MQNHNQKNHDKGASHKTAHPKTHTPPHEDAGEKPAEQKSIGIGMPASPEEMERLKEKARKLDD